MHKKFNFVSVKYLWKTYVSFTLFIEILFDKKCADRISQISITISYAKFPTRRRFFSAIQTPEQFLLGILKP